jgi:hypothetical protein
VQALYEKAEEVAEEVGQANLVKMNNSDWQAR